MILVLLVAAVHGVKEGREGRGAWLDGRCLEVSGHGIGESGEDGWLFNHSVIVLLGLRQASDMTHNLNFFCWHQSVLGGQCGQHRQDLGRDELVGARPLLDQTMEGCCGGKSYSRLLLIRFIVWVARELHCRVL